jgi:hypothetical protein
MELLDFVCSCVMKLDYWAECANINLDINYGHYRTKQTFIVELGFPGVHSDEDHQR